VAACLALGLMAKAMLVTVPLVFLLLDFWPGRGSSGDADSRTAWRTLIAEKVPLFAIVAAASVVTFLVQQRYGAVKTLTSFPMGIRLQNALVSYLDYLRDTVWPAGLGVFYPFPEVVPAGRVALAAFALVAITFAAWRLARRAPYVVVGWLWFLGMLVPVIGLVQVGAQARADRYMYLPIIGLAIAAAWGAAAVATTPWRRRVGGAAGVLAIAVCAVTAHAQAQYWRDNFTLWSRTAAVTDHMNNFGVYFSLGEYLRETGRPQEAISRYEASLRKNPSYADSHLGLGRALVATGRSDRAAAALAEAVRLNPGSVEARMALGIVLSDLGRPADAVPHLAEAVRLRPDVAEGQWRLALALAGVGKLGEALQAFGEAVRLDPRSAAVRNDYGWALAQNGQDAAAVEQLNEALRLKPDFVDAHHNLGRVLLAGGRTADGLGHLSEAVRLEPSFVEARFSLAVALLRAGRVDDGAKELREVLRLDPANAAAARLLASIGKQR
jgi:protein O-mannosyl-transferase